MVARIEAWRRERKWSAGRIAFELQHRGTTISVRTVSRILERLGLNRRRFLDPAGESNRVPGRIHARWPGHMVHVDIKKVGRIPDGGGWRAHGRGSAQALAGDRAKAAGAKRGYVYLHSAVDGFSRLAYTEQLPDEKASTAAAFWQRARRFFATHGIEKIHRVVTDNGAFYRSTEFARRLGDSRHQRITPYTPRHNGKVERYNRILAEELHLRPLLRLRGRTAASAGGVELPLQLPSAPHCDRKPATGLQSPPRHQRHGLIQLPGPRRPAHRQQVHHRAATRRLSGRARGEHLLRPGVYVQVGCLTRHRGCGLNL